MYVCVQNTVIDNHNNPKVYVGEINASDQILKIK